MLLSILYIIGITAEAITGALAAGREKMDIFGVVIIASMTAIGGGSVRECALRALSAWVGKTSRIFYYRRLGCGVNCNLSRLLFAISCVIFTPFSWYWMPLGLSCFPLLVPKSR